MCVLHKSGTALRFPIDSSMPRLPGVHIRGNPRFACLYISLHSTALIDLQAIIFVQAPYPLENVIHTASACYAQIQLLYKTDNLWISMVQDLHSTV